MPTFFTDLIRLLKSATLWLLPIIPVAASLMFAYFSWRKGMTEEQAQKDHLQKLMNGVVLYSAIALGADGIVTVILNFFIH